MGWWCALHAAALVFVVCSASGAQEREPGLWVEGVFGGTYARGPFESEGIETQVGGAGPDLAATLGHTFSENWALGVVPNVALTFVSGTIDDSSVSMGYIASVSVAGAYRAPGDGMILRPALGVARAAYIGGNDDVGGPRQTTREWDFPPVHGPVVSMGFGLAKGLSGFAVKLSYARLRGDEASYDVVGIGFGFLLERWGAPARPR